MRQLAARPCGCVYADLLLIRAEISGCRSASARAGGLARHPGAAPKVWRRRCSGLDAKADCPTVRRVLRILFGGALVVAFVASLAWIVFGWPLPFRLWIALAVVAGGSLTAFLTFFVPNPLSERLRRALTAGAACTGLIAAVIAVPALQDAGTSQESQNDTSLPGSAASTESPSPTAEPYPLTATLEFGEKCEGFVLPNSLLRSLPKNKDITAEWAYEHGGATGYGVGFLLLEGTSEDAVILKEMRVIDLEQAPVPSRISEVLPCSASGGFIETDTSMSSLVRNPR